MLASALADALQLPVAAVDDERRKLLRPGESWPRDDRQTWGAMRAKVDAHPALIVETVGGSAQSAELLRGRRVLTILCKARPMDRYHRLVRKSRSKDPLVGNPSRYLASVTKILDPRVQPDAVWNGKGDFDALVETTRAFLGETDGGTRAEPQDRTPAT